METTAHGWRILDRDAGVAARGYSFTAEGLATTFTARLPDGKLLVVSPSLRTPDAAFTELEALGEVGYVMANNGFHHLGLPEWRARYPGARFFAPALAAPRIADKNADAPALEPLDALAPLLGDKLLVRDQEGTKCGESWVIALTDQGPIYYASDLLSNYTEVPGNFLIKTLMKLTGSAPGFRVFKLAMLAIVKDRKGVLQRLLADLKAHPPVVIVPAHGPILDQPGLAAEAQAVVSAAA